MSNSRGALAAAVLMLAALGSGPSVAQSARHAAMVVDANSGRVLMAEQADEPRYPASLTKMMTIYLALEQMELGRLKPETPIRISQEAASQQPSKLDLEPGETIPALDALKVLIVKSANDIAVAVAEHIAGNEREFARRMTSKAQQLGMSRTTFRNASGLPDREQVTTARDMLTLAMRLHDDFPRYYGLFALRSHTFRGKTFANHNTLLRSLEGTEGMKTGYIGSSGFNVTTSFRRGPKHLFGVVFGGASAGSRNATMRTALTRALPQAAIVRTRAVSRPTLVADARPMPVRPAPSPVPRRVAPTPARVEAEPRPAAVGRPQPFPPRPAPMVVAEATTPPPAAPKPAPVPVARVRPVLVAPPARPQPPAGLLTVPPGATAFVPPPPAPGRQVPPALPPSSLQAQARALEAPARLAGPAAGAPPGGYQLQIGAYTSQADAERALAATRARAATALGEAPPVTIAVQKENRTLYRARFSGFTAARAAAACNELRRQAIDCFVMRGE